MPTFRTSDGVNVSYTEEGDGHPVVLIHGFTAPAAAWALTTDALVASGYRVIAFTDARMATPRHRSSDSGWRGMAATSASFSITWT